jgi:hypothetical protein
MMSSSTDYLPAREAELVTWTQNFHAILSGAGPGGMLGVSAVQIAAFTTLFNSWITAYNAAHAGPTRGPAATATKNSAKEAVIDGANGVRELVKIIQANPSTTNTDRQELLITVPDVEPTPVPVPAFAPGIEIVSVVGRTLRIRLKDVENPENRGKPAGVVGAAVFTFVGENPPADIKSWQFQGNFTRTADQVEFPTSVAPASKVWLTAYWFNTKGESGPATEPPVFGFTAPGLAEVA